MSKYKVGFLVNSNANAFCKNVELLKEWVWDTIETNVEYLETEEEVKNWWSIGD